MPKPVQILTILCGAVAGAFCSRPHARLSSHGKAKQMELVRKK
jgi:hypothetical protein